MTLQPQGLQRYGLDQIHRTRALVLAGLGDGWTPLRPLAWRARRSPPAVRAAVIELEAAGLLTVARYPAGWLLARPGLAPPPAFRPGDHEERVVSTLRDLGTWASTAELARACGVSEDTVRVGVRRAVASGVVWRTGRAKWRLCWAPMETVDEPSGRPFDPELPADWRSP